MVTCAVSEQIAVSLIDFKYWHPHSFLPFAFQGSDEAVEMIKVVRDDVELIRVRRGQKMHPVEISDDESDATMSVYDMATRGNNVAEDATRATKRKSGDQSNKQRSELVSPPQRARVSSPIHEGDDQSAPGSTESCPSTSGVKIKQE